MLAVLIAKRFDVLNLATNSTLHSTMVRSLVHVLEMNVLNGWVLL